MFSHQDQVDLIIDHDQVVHAQLVERQFRNDVVAPFYLKSLNF